MKDNSIFKLLFRINTLKLIFKNPHLIIRFIILIFKRDFSSISRETKKIAGENNKLFPSLLNNVDFIKSIRKSFTSNSVLVFNHSYGGGSQRFIESEIGKITNLSVVNITYNEVRKKYFIEFQVLNENNIFEFDEICDLHFILKIFTIGEIHVNQLVSYDDIYGIIDFIVSAKSKYDCKILIYINDYFSICPSFNLMRDTDQFCGVCDGSDEKCLEKNSFVKKKYSASAVHDWRVKWGEVFIAADSIICFSISSRELLLCAYPRLDKSKIVIKSHSVDYIRKARIEKKDNILRIGLIGNLTVIKGSAVLEDMVKLSDRDNLNVNFILIGTVDRDIKSNRFTSTGAYQTEELVDLVEENRIDLILIPSICPETFSYTTEESIQMGLPVAVFNVGAPAERVGKYEKGLVIDIVDAEFAIHDILAWYEKIIAL